MWMYPPSEVGQAWKVAERKRDWPTRYDEIAVDPDTGAVTDRVNFAQWPLLAKLTEWTIEAHMGLLFGIANQIVLALSMIGLITVIVRGYRMWWQRRPTRGSAWAVGRPAAAGRDPPVAAAGNRGDRGGHCRHRMVPAVVRVEPAGLPDRGRDRRLPEAQRPRPGLNSGHRMQRQE